MDKTCHKCGKMGHFAKKCKSKKSSKEQGKNKKEKVRYMEEESSDDSEDGSGATCNIINSEIMSKLKKCGVNKIPIEKQLYAYGAINPLMIKNASPVGLGAILSQKQSDGNFRPVTFASRTLTDVEQRYSQTEREALAVVWGCERFHLYLYGKEFILVTDHKPLEVIYSPKSKPPARIERWAMRLNLIRLKDHESLYLISRKQTLQLAHEGHQGIVKKKLRLREKVWWPGIDQDAENLVKSCRACQVVGPVPKQEPIMRTQLPDGPWQDLCADLMGPFPTGEYVFVVVDYYSRWQEVAILK
ncbi:unnamed protein product [Mytilus coruscus]|uniref:CCHC-type domain-containing protein n=1 Tax=Mytilus coruscus TaxID=42192 RepID=A0A6J8DPI6_MYTCO|nr:unnamed protein product [Mytilus coruscus]